MPILSNGAAGGQVFTLQALLNRHGGKLDNDGMFGPKTEAVVKAFQRGAGLRVDGIVSTPGPTWTKLRSIGAAAPEELLLKPPGELSFGRDFEVMNSYFEGVDLRAHQVGGLWHIGKGHSETSKRPPIPRAGMKISWREMVDVWEKDKAAILAEMRKLFAEAKPMTQRMWDSLGSLYFNRQRTFKEEGGHPGAGMLEAVIAGDHPALIRIWHRLASAPALDGKYYRGLGLRRRTEADCAEGGPYKLGE
jgi:GH24 family phage-related lysozyme (muramidase)